MTPEQRRLARHALGLPNDGRKSYRNHYLTPSKGQAREVWDALAEAKLAFAGMSGTTGTFFHLTRAGAELALCEGEELDASDFPPIGAH